MASNNKTSCEWYDHIDGKPSKLHKGLIEKQTRPEGNLLYAMYKTSNLPERMDSAGFERNAQGQHKAEDVIRFLDWNKDKSDLRQAERELKAKDKDGKTIYHTDLMAALKKVDAFNDSRNALVANLYLINKRFDIVVAPKSSRTYHVVDDVKKKLKLLAYYKQVLAPHGIDIDKEIPESVMSQFFHAETIPLGMKNAANGVRPWQYTDSISGLILFLNQQSPLVQRVISSFGSIDEAARAATTNGNINGKYTDGQMRLLEKALEENRHFPGYNVENLKIETQVIAKSAENSRTTDSITEELHKLNKKYNIDFNILHKTDTKIKTLSDAAIESVLNLERQLRFVEKKDGDSKKIQHLIDQKNVILEHLPYHHYYFGVIMFLQEASRQLNYNPETKTSVIDDILKEASEKEGTNLERAMAMAKALQEIKRLKSLYEPIVYAIANDDVTLDENISELNLELMRGVAKNLKEIFNKQNKKIDEEILDTIENIMIEIVGNETPEGISMHDALRMAAQDSSLFDFLYDLGRASNPIIGAMQHIVDTAKNERRDILNDFSLRIRRATDALYKSGSTSEFMYDEDGYIASPWDWKRFYDEQRKFLFSLEIDGLDELEKTRSIERWIKENTREEEVADIKTGRKERVPADRFLKAGDASYFQKGWTEAQVKYYDEMMHIKGEIESLLPTCAQSLFRPPQVRRSFLDALSHAKSAKDVLKALRNWIMNLFTVRENDVDFARNGLIIDGRENKVVESDFTSSELRSIPIFYINNVEKGELLKDFSSALQHLAATAANYYTMNNVADIVEFMGDFAINQPKRGDKQAVDVVGSKVYKIAHDVFKTGKNNATEAIVEGFLSQYIYGQKLKGQAGHWYSKLILNLIHYTSFKNLSTNVLGAVNNFLVGELQMLIDASSGEFYNMANLVNAHKRMFGGAGVSGEVMELLTNNQKHRATLFREKFDPMNENFSDKEGQRYYKSIFRQMIGHDCSFIGYASGEYLMHYINMYAILDNQKVFLNGKQISLFDAYEVTEAENGNAELKVKEGVTIGKKVDTKWVDTGVAIDKEYENKIKGIIRYCNDTCHGAKEKGLINQYLLGRAANNFRQWMWEHYSRRFRERHFDYTLRSMREGYYYSWYHFLFNEDTKDKWKSGTEGKAKVIGRTAGEIASLAIPMFIRDYTKFSLRAQAQWHNLTEDQKYNIRRVHAEMNMLTYLLALGFILGTPEDNEGKWWRRWWVYHTKRLIMETEAATPTPYIIPALLTLIQTPIPAVSTVNSILYPFYGIGDIDETIQTGKHAGENKWWRTTKKRTLPFFKDIERLQSLDEDDTIFKVFDDYGKNK